MECVEGALDERRGVRVVNVVGDGPIARVSFQRYDRQCEFNSRRHNGSVCTRRPTLPGVSFITSTPHGSLVTISGLDHEKQVPAT